MDKHTRDAFVTGYESIIPTFELPDKDDRHVLAAAIVGSCDVIVTQSLKDFPPDILALYKKEIQHPDEFLANHLNLAPGVFCSAVKKVRARLNKPPYSIQEYLAILTQIGLVQTFADLKEYADVL